jgi:hypothetical protein
MFWHFESDSGIQQNACIKGIYATARCENCIWIDTRENCILDRRVSSIYKNIYIYIGLMFGRIESESCIWQSACE